MKRAVKTLWIAVNLIRSLPALAVYRACRRRQVIDEDVSRWVEVVLRSDTRRSSWWSLHTLMLHFPEFRNLLYLRLSGCNPILSRVIRPLYPPLKSLFLSTAAIGPGMVIHHGFSTIVNAEAIGSNFSVAQQVTIGSTEEGRPTIGNNVQVTAGAVVIGKIRVGDGCIVGANATVTKDVPDNSVVVGNPAFIVRRDGVRVREDL